MRAVALALILVSGCTWRTQVRGTPQQRETVYAVIGLLALGAVLAVIIAGAPEKTPAMPAPAAP
jgi:hypothetical protein